MKTLTENESLTYNSSGDARLDFLFHVIEGSSPERTTELLEKSWTQAPLDTMKLVLNTRDIRRGKGIRGQFLICAKWLVEHQLESLLANLELLSEFGCWKDLLNLLLVALFGELPHDAFTETGKKEPVVSKFDRVILRTVSKEQRQQLANTKTTIRQIRRRLVCHKGSAMIVDEQVEEKEGEPKAEVKEVKIENETEKKQNKVSTQIEIVKIKDVSEEKKPLEHKLLASYFPEKCKKSDKAVYRVKTSREKIKLMQRHRKEFFTAAYSKKESNFRRLYDQIVELFAVQLVADYANINAGKPYSLAAKWLPNPGRLFDKYLFILVPIGRRFFALQGKNPENPKLESNHRIEQLFRAVYAQLRAKMHLPEIAMSARSWPEVQYFAVPSVAMLRYKAVFSRADFDRFADFVKAKPVKGGALTPGEIIKETVEIGFENGTLYGELLSEETLEKEKALELAVLDAQWKSLVDDVKSKGDLLIKDSLAICDVSGSMLDSSVKVSPMYGAIGLTLMLLQLCASGKWAKKVIAFSEEPSLADIDIETSNLKQQIKRMMSIPFGYSTDLNKAFDLILNFAKEQKLGGESMPKVLFIFTDMEFDEALPEKTNFEVAQKQFADAGYAMPLVVFWNLKGDKASKSTPVQCFQEGVFLLSGYSVQTINFFFTASDVSDMTPLTMLRRILDDNRYDGVKVVLQEVTHSPKPMTVDEIEENAVSPMCE